MNLLVLYLLLLKASLTTFSGLSSLPLVREDFVARRGVLTDRQLSAAVVAGRTAPGPNGSYLVSVGYFVAGVPGACAGALAVMSPAFLIIPLLHHVGRRADRPVVRSVIECVMLASAGLIVSATVPLARESIAGWAGVLIAAGSFAVLTFTRLSTLWVMLASAAIGLLSVWN
jgi:chromate transporter